MHLRRDVSPVDCQGGCSSAIDWGGGIEKEREAAQRRREAGTGCTRARARPRASSIGGALTQQQEWRNPALRRYEVLVGAVCGGEAREAHGRGHLRLARREHLEQPRHDLLVGFESVRVQ